MIEADQLTKEQKMQRAEEAKRLLEHPLMREAFTNLKFNYFEAWTAMDPADTVKREAIFHAARVLNDVETHLRIVMSQGRVERVRVEKMAAGKPA